MKLLARPGWCLFLAVSAGGFLLGWCQPDRAGLGPSPASAASLPRPDQEHLNLRVTPRYEIPTNLKFVGVNSCATQGCHAGASPNRDTVVGSEHLIWAARDPHATAYKILFNEVSVRMAKALNHRDAAGNPIPAHRDAVCLRCHGLDTTKKDRLDYYEFGKESPAELRADAVLADAVSCEACHGAAEKYFNTHYEAGWKNLSSAEKAKYGLYPTKDLNFRVQMCASCHVGHTAGEDVNHDLYAAGHPRLAWEYTMHDVKYPKHYIEKSYGRDFQARAWAIGQVASLRSAVQLTLHRAEMASQDRVAWPELSEYSCFSCHQSLEGSVPRVQGRGGRGLGVLPWNTLFRPAIEILATDGRVFFPTRATPSLKAVQELTGLMEPRKSNQVPDPRKVAEVARIALRELDGWATDLQAAAERDSFTRPIPAAELQKLFARIAQANLDRNDGKAQFKDGDWDYVASGHMSLMSLYYGSVQLDPSLRNPRTAGKLAEIRDLMKFSRDFRRPLTYSPSSVVTAFDGLLK